MVLTEEPILEGVLPDDNMVLRNVIYCIGSLNHMQKICIGWELCNRNDSYILQCGLATGWTIGLPEMQAIVDVNPCRVASVIVAHGNTLSVRVLKSVSTTHTH